MRKRLCGVGVGPERRHDVRLFKDVVVYLGREAYSVAVHEMHNQGICGRPRFKWRAKGLSIRSKLSAFLKVKVMQLFKRDKPLAACRSLSRDPSCWLGYNALPLVTLALKQDEIKCSVKIHSGIEALPV